MSKFSPLPEVFGTVTIGERGQVVIPAKVRKSYNLKAGDRLIVVARADGGPIGLIPAKAFGMFMEHHEKLLAEMKKNVEE